MKKNSLKILLLLAVMLTAALVLSACGLIPGLQPEDTTSAHDAEIRAVYDLYVENMNATSQTPLTYELWLSMIRGEDGKDGKTPFIGENGNWWIGETDTGVRAAGRDGVDGENGQDGADGTNGTNGKDGRGVLLMQIIAGDLWVFYTDGTSANLGRIGESATTTAAMTTTRSTPAATSASTTEQTPPRTQPASTTAAPVTQSPLDKEWSDPVIK